MYQNIYKFVTVKHMKINKKETIFKLKYAQLNCK